ncbi:hypothetical protein ACOMHN_064459 [Nucella lapillus]
MALTSVAAAVAIFSVLVLEARGQFPGGIVGGSCKSDKTCLDSVNQVCDTNSSPHLCKVKAGSSCARQPQLCVTGAQCPQAQTVCTCQTAPTGDGLCSREVMTTPKVPVTTTTTAATTVVTTERADDSVTVQMTSTVPPKTSGASTWTTIRGLSHVIQLMATIFLCSIWP